MNFSSFCKICDRVPISSEVKEESCNLDHEADDRENNFYTQQALIQMWIERFLTYQEELMEKSNQSIINGTKFFLGCPVCDNLIKICSVIVPQEAAQLASQNSENQESSSNQNDSSFSTTPCKEQKESIRCHTVRHACAHLRYYPYECFACEQIGRYQKKPDLSEMMRHIKDNHLNGDKPEKINLEEFIKEVRITKLEKFIDYYLRSRTVVRFEPVVSLSQSSSKSSFVDSSRGRKILPKNSSSTSSSSISSNSNSSSSSSSTSISRNRLLSSDNKSEVKTTTINITTQLDGSNSWIKTQSNTAEGIGGRINDGNRLKITSDSLRKIKGSSLIRSNQTNNSLETSQSSFQRHFGNIFDDEDMIKFSSFNQEEDLVNFDIYLLKERKRMNDNYRK